MVNFEGERVRHRVRLRRCVSTRPPIYTPTVIRSKRPNQRNPRVATPSERSLPSGQNNVPSGFVRGSDGTVRLIDINGRLSGAVAVPFEAGMDLPWIWYQVSAGIEDVEASDAKPGVRVRWILGDGIALVEHLMAGEVREALGILTPSVGLRHDDLVWSDPMPFVGQALDYLWKFVRGRGSTKPKVEGMVR